MTEDDVKAWFRGYLDVFAAAGRGEREPAALLAHYGVPLVVTLRTTCLTLTTADDVAGLLARQVAEMQAAGYDRSDLIHEEVQVLNAVTALYRGSFSRLRADGSQISALTATYLLTDSTVGRRIAALVVHDE